MKKKNKNKTQINIARAGGGTWGHVFPIQSLIQYAESLQKYQSKIHHHYRFGAEKSLERQVATMISEKIKNLTFIPLFSGKRRREKTVSSLMKNILDMFRFLIWIFQAIYYLRRYCIDIVFCKGGYVALPVVLAAKLLGKTIYVHESDTRPWLVNRIASKFAKHIYTGFSKVLPWAKVVWQLLSDELVVDTDWLEKSSQTNILLMGWSQWAMTLYSAILELLPALESKNFHFTVILGKLNTQLKSDFETFSNVEVREFCSQKELWALYMRSDIAITRAGTTSLAEQDLFDLKLIMVPIPRTHDQFANAKRYVEHRNGILLDELLKLKNFKKTITQKDIKTAISEPKNQILSDMLG